MIRSLFLSILSSAIIVHCSFAAPPLHEWNGFKGVYGNHLRVRWDDVRNAPSSIDGAVDAKAIARNLRIRLPILDSVDAGRIVEAFLVEQNGLFQLDLIELSGHPTRSWTSPVFNQFHVVAYQQTVAGVPIYGTRAWVAIDENARIFRVGFKLHPNINIATIPLISEFEALEQAKIEFRKFVGHEGSEQANLTILPPGFILPDKSVISDYTLVWNIFLEARIDHRPVYQHIIIDAVSGSVWANDEAADNFSATVSGNMNLHYLWDIPESRDHIDVAIGGVSAFVDLTHQSLNGPSVGSDVTDAVGDYSISWDAIEGDEYWLYFSMPPLTGGTHIYLTHPFLADSSSPSLVYNLGEFVNQNYFNDLSSGAWQADQMRLFFEAMDSSYAPSQPVEIEIYDWTPPFDIPRYWNYKIDLNYLSSFPDTLRHEYTHFVLGDLYGICCGGFGPKYTEGDAMDEGFADYYACRSSRDINGKSDRILHDPSPAPDYLEDDYVFPNDWDDNDNNGHKNGRIVRSMLWDLIKVDPNEPDGETLAYPHGFDHIIWDALVCDQPRDFPELRDALVRISEFWVPSYVQRVHEVCEAHGIRSASPTFFGHIATDVNWSDDIQLLGDVIVDAGATLSINPGVTLTFVANNDALGGGADPTRAELIIDGGLTAHSVTFESTDGAAGSWGGITISSQSGEPPTTLTNCTVQDATHGIQLSGASSSVSIDQTDISDCSNTGIYASNSTVSVSNGNIFSNGSNGVYALNNSDVTLDSVVIYDNSLHGILAASSTVSIDQTDISDCSSSGIYANNSTVSVSNGNILSNGSNGVYALSNSDVTLDTVVIYSNSQYGVFAADASTAVTINDSFIFGNSNHGSYVTANAMATLNNTQVYNNDGDGIKLEAASGTSVLDGCLIHSNGGDGIEILDSNATIRNNTHVFNNAFGLLIHENTAAIAVSLEDSIFENRFRSSVSGAGGGVSVRNVTIKGD